MHVINNNIGIGAAVASINVYIENTPPLSYYLNLESVEALASGEITNIGKLTGNHWRKIFNVYAKLIFELNSYNFTSWQELRDGYLLQNESNERLLFSGLTMADLSVTNSKQKNIVHIVTGKNYAEKLQINSQCYWVSDSFAVNESKKLIICPYFDYRQLSNIKITQLVQLIKKIQSL